MKPMQNMPDNDDEAMLMLMDMIFDNAVGVILETGSFASLHAHLKEAVRPLALAIIAAEPGATAALLTQISTGLATQMAVDLWNTTPIPENHFQPRKIARPERNSPCPCGSLRKYKQCCGAIETFSLTFPPEEMAARVLKRHPPERIGEITRLGVPLHTLGIVAEAWLQEGRTADVASLLEPVFINLNKLDQRAELAADMLLNAYLEQGNEAARLAFVAHLKTAPDKMLQGTAYQREATLCADRNDYQKAWAAFQTALHLTPNNPALAQLEILLLLSEGRVEETYGRIAIWSTKLANDPHIDQQAFVQSLFELVATQSRNPEDRRLAELPDDYPLKRLQLHISLEDIEPPIWRRIEVENSLSFGDLHHIIQTVMGWEDEHLHEFIVGDDRIGPTSEYADAFEDAILPEDDVEIGQLIGRKKSFRYIYDFGDNWAHRITIEKRLPSNDQEPAVTLLAGERACPPEDCGGVSGYYGILEAKKHPRRASNREILDWLGPFNPETFKLAALQVRMKRLFNGL